MRDGAADKKNRATKGSSLDKRGIRHLGAFQKVQVPDENWLSSDGHVRAGIAIWDESLHIYTFAAAESGRGYGTAALGELRELAGNRQVIVFAIGDEGSESHSWWTHQKAVDRVDELR